MSVRLAVGMRLDGKEIEDRHLAKSFTSAEEKDPLVLGNWLCNEIAKTRAVQKPNTRT